MTQDIADRIEAQLIGPGGMFEVVEEDVLGERMHVFRDRKRSLRELLESSTGFGELEHIVHGDRRISYADHTRLVAATAQALRERYGVTRGDRVAILAANCPEWIITFWATVSLGGIVAGLNGWWTADEIRYGVTHSDPKVLVGDRRRLARVEGLDLGVPVLEIESEFTTLTSAAGTAMLPDDPIDEDDPAVILYTSGTTGRPKGAVGTHRGICGFAHVAMVNGLRLIMMAAARGGPAEERPPQNCALVTVPLFHLSGLYAGAVMMLAIGSKIVLRSGRFDPEDVLRLIEKERVTSWAGLGSMAPRVLNHPNIDRYDLSSLRNLGSGGAPTSPATLERMKAVVPNGAQGRGIGYGLSESVTSVTMIGGDELEERPTSVGRAAPTHEIEIRGPDDTVLPEGQEGEIHVRSPYVMLEYWRNAAATREVLKPGRWLATGDIGHLENGYLYINARARDMILRAAENIYPTEIEHRIEAHPDVAEVAVVGVDHPELGQEVKAVVVPAAGAVVDTDALRSWTAATLAAYKVPSLWEVRTEPLPRNAAGKVLKNVLTGAAASTFVED